jgi:hypothetical protein
MQKVMKKVFLGVSALVSIIVVSKIVGHPPIGIEQWILYAFPGGILMVFLFDPLSNLFFRHQQPLPKVEDEKK